MAKEVLCGEPQNSETPKGVLVKTEAACTSLFEERVCFVFFMAYMFRRTHNNEMGVLGPKTSLVQQYSLGRYLQYNRL